ncbi:uncharacterized protein IL334_000473 [Kwoniella shivajii]|uniref:COQ9 C-terminal domain-containing protein n=1 Tax=Kwoniella shivajii TaxID=564305 RepID=A0ABZ1CPT0_9TREE|nr:hypothetical protein IL334_000473 [Kwoniella shivajii]
MALRSQILNSALPLLTSHSFARPTLIHALRNLKPEVTDPEAVIDTIFGSGSVGASKALVQQWEEGGLEVMRHSVKSGDKDITNVLRRRLEYSSQVGPNLIEAHANLTTPTSSLSLPLPSIPIILTLLSSLRLPTKYIPPLLAASSALSGTKQASTILSKVSQVTGDRIPLITINPLGPLGYAWRIADEALYLTEEKGKVKRGYWNEPTGPGPEWYTKRIGLSLVYLSSESTLLKSYPSSAATPDFNTHLPDALSSLESNLARYKSTIESLERSEENLGDVGGFIDYVAKSWSGLIKSRYF